MPKAVNARGSETPPASIARLAVTLAAICAVCALLLGLMNMATRDRIEQAAQAKKNAAMTAVLAAQRYEPVAYTGTDGTIQEAYRAVDAGYVILVTPSGSFGGGLKLMVGVNSDMTVSGVEIVESAETSGLGANAKKPAFRSQFVGKAGEVKLTKDGGEIQALTGATITSRAVCAGVSSALAAAATLD